MKKFITSVAVAILITFCLPACKKSSDTQQPQTTLQKIQNKWLLLPAMLFRYINIINLKQIVMKSIIISTMFLVFSATSFCQPTNLAQPYSHEDYLKKSKQQKTVGWILLGSGVALTIYSLTGKQDYTLRKFFGPIGGLFLSVYSVHFFNVSANNKRKAKEVSAYLKFENAPSFQQTKINFLFYPSFAIKVNL